MKGKAIIPLVLGLCFGLIAVKVGIDQIKKAQGSDADKETTTVVYASEDIGAFAEITKEMVILRETTDSRLVSDVDYIHDAEELLGGKDRIGRVTAKAIPKGVPVLNSMLAPPKTRPGMVGRIPRGFRAVSVPVDEVTSVAYQISPGDWVDVIVVMEVPSGSGRRGKETIAETILQRIQVAAIGQAKPAGDVANTRVKVKPAKSATLFVTHEDATKLHLAATRGKLTLSMRGVEDETIEDMAIADSSVFKHWPGQTEQVVMAQPTPVTRPPELILDQPFGITVFRGGPTGSTERTTFMNRRSRTILDVSAGATPGLSTRMRAPSSAGPSRGSTTQRDRPAPAEELEQPVVEEESKSNSDEEAG